MAEQAFSINDSFGGRKWSLRSYDDQTVSGLMAYADGSELLARLLVGRGVTPGSVEHFLTPTLRQSFPDPFSFRDMEKAANITLDALIDGRQVTVFADYDVDGGTSSAILARHFRAWGRDIGLYVPDR